MLERLSLESYWLERLAGTNTLAYFEAVSLTKRKKIYNLDNRSQCYKAFNDRNLRMFIAN